MKKLILYFLLASAITSLRAVERKSEGMIAEEKEKVACHHDLSAEDRIFNIKLDLLKLRKYRFYRMIGEPYWSGLIFEFMKKFVFSINNYNELEKVLSFLEQCPFWEDELIAVGWSFWGKIHDGLKDLHDSLKDFKINDLANKDKSQKIIEWMSYPYGPRLRSAIKPLLRGFLDASKKPVVRLSKIAFYSDSEIDFEEGDLDYIFKYITKAIKKKYFIPSEILDILWTKLTLNKNRRDLENNPMAREIAEKATEISDIMMKNFLEDKENAPSRELLKGVLAHTLKELYPMEILKYRAKDQGIPSSASKFLKLPPCLLEQIENYNDLNTLGKAANRELLLQIGEKIYPATITVNKNPKILPPTTAIDTSLKVIDQESHGTKKKSQNTRITHLDIPEERKE